MKDCIENNVKLGLLVVQIMTKHENIHLIRTPLKNHGFAIMYPLGFWRVNQNEAVDDAFKEGPTRFS
jgi:hypothetical protein